MNQKEAFIPRKRQLQQKNFTHITKRIFPDELMTIDEYIEQLIILSI